MADTNITNPTTPSTNDLNLDLDFGDMKIPQASEHTDINFSDIPKTNEQSLLKQDSASAELTVNSEQGTTKNQSSNISLNPQKSSVEEDRLKKEDAIVEKKEEIISEDKQKITEDTSKVIETKTSSEIPLKSSEIISNPQESPSQKIIDELTSLPTNTTITTNSEQLTTNNTGNQQANQPTNQPANQPTASVFNLDNIVGTTPTSTVTPIVTPSVEIQTPTPVTSPVETSTIPNSPIPNSEYQIPNIPTITLTPIVQTATPSTSIPIKKRGGSKITTTFLFLLLIGASVYVLKVMYPIEYTNLKANVTSIISSQPNTNEQSLETILEATGVTETGILNFELLPSTGEILDPEIQTDMTETGTLTSTTGFNAFQDLENILTGSATTPLQEQNQLTQLQQFADEGKAFMELGTKINDKTMLKYGTYVYKKASELVQSIENNKEIDNSKIDSYIAQFSGYLNKLTTLSYDTSADLGSQIVIPSPAPENDIPEGTGTQTNNLIQDVDWNTQTGSN